MFLGMNFAPYMDESSFVAVSESPISTLKLSNLIADELYATKKVLVKFDWQIPDSWDFNTHLHAKFNGSTHAGNVEYSQQIVSAIKIKKRYVGDFDWITIYEKQIEKNENFNVEFLDYYEPAGRDIEYAYTAVIGGIDMAPVSSTIHSDFSSYFICGRNGEAYPMIVGMDNAVTYNRQSQVIVAPGRKYPYVINNGISQYYSGTINVTFIEMDEHCQLDAENGWQYRNHLDKFLTNGEPKILKSFEGDMWMVNVVNSLPRSNSGHPQLVSHQIEWVECGDPTSTGDLYDNGFINTDSDRK